MPLNEEEEEEEEEDQQKWKIHNKRKNWKRYKQERNNWKKIIKETNKKFENLWRRWIWYFVTWRFMWCVLATEKNIMIGHNL